MKIEDIDGLSVLNQTAIDCLATGAPDHRAARFQVDMHNVVEPEKAMGCRGGQLASRDREAARAKLPFQKLTPSLREAMFDLLRASSAVGRPLYLLCVWYRKEGEGWQVEKVRTQTLEERKQFLAERVALEEKVRAILRGLPITNWTGLSLWWDDILNRGPKVSFGKNGRLNESMDLTPEVLSTVEELKSFYTDRGFELYTMSFNVEGGPRKAVVEVDDYYG